MTEIDYSVFILVNVLILYGLHQFLRKPEIIFSSRSDRKKIIKSLTPKYYLSILPTRIASHFSSAGLVPILDLGGIVPQVMSQSHTTPYP
ncbi:MAG: hypothetical protein HC917_12935 [Richelia sp. SM2_1_7]|nr:hypothetical protein [Richelia sp. SM2_1_7]